MSMLFRIVYIIIEIIRRDNLAVKNVLIFSTQPLSLVVIINQGETFHGMSVSSYFHSPQQSKSTTLF